MKFNCDLRSNDFSFSEYLFDIRTAYSNKYITDKILNYYSHKISDSISQHDYEYYIKYTNGVLIGLRDVYDTAVVTNSDARKEYVIYRINKIYIGSVNSSLFRLVWEHNIELLNKDNAWIFIMHMLSIFNFIIYS